MGTDPVPYATEGGPEVEGDERAEGLLVDTMEGLDTAFPDARDGETELNRDLNQRLFLRKHYTHLGKITCLETAPYEDGRE